MGSICWNIWRERNCRILRDKSHIQVQYFMHTYLDIMHYIGFSEEGCIKFSDLDEDLQQEVDTQEEEATLRETTKGE